MADDVAYQHAAQIRQLLAERENAEAYGQATRVEAIDKQLKQFGVGVKKAKRSESDVPQGRETKQDKQHTA